MADPAPAAPTTPEPAPEAKAPEPEPVDVPLAFGKMSYKLLSSGRGPKAVAKIDTKPGAKHAVQLSIDVAAKQVAPAELGGTKEEVVPTLVLAGDLESGEADKDGAKFKLTFTGADAKPRASTKATPEQLKAEAESLIGTMLSGSVAANGQLANLVQHVDKPTDKALSGLQLVRVAMAPLWPMLPTEAIGVGAKWRVTWPSTVGDQVQTVRTTDYEVVARKGSTWTFKGTTKISGEAQPLNDVKVDGISGTGSFEGTLSDGVFVPTSTTKAVIDFTVHIPSKDAKDAKDAKGAKGAKDAKGTTVQFHLDHAIAIAPK